MIALLLPFTFGMQVSDAPVMVAGIYMAGPYAGSITGITLNIPGAPSGAITTPPHKFIRRTKAACGAKILSI